VVTKELRDMIANNATVNEMTRYAMSQGMSTLKMECIRLVRQGITSFNEVMDITYSQE
jgi:type IV pilus assembly protein PilB